ncbi:MAG TPA: methyltransferase domain-containing protein [Polyangiaceae bacterium]
MSASERFFEAIAGRYDRVYALEGASSRERLRRVLGELPPAPARVVDLGVGTGREIPALLDAGHEVTGVDVSQAMLDRCARRARPVPLVRADFWEPLPFAPSSFDAAVALHGTLAHPPAEDAIAKLGAELARVVRPGGVLVAEVPSPAWLERIEALPAMDDRVLRRTGPRTCVYEDRAAGASIEARVLDAAEWEAALAPTWRARVEPLGAFEWLVVAHRDPRC